MGLKAYDLVWSEGKSAAWRYPCEINELSAFAPAVEEQPFDRFYKRPAQTTATTVAACSSRAAEPAVSESIATPVTVESTKTPGKRIIYVTMPAGKAPATKSNPEPATTREPVTDREPLLARESTLEPIIREAIITREPAREPLLTTTDTPDPAHLAYESGTSNNAPRSSYARATVEEYSAHLPGDRNPNVEFMPRSKPHQSARVIRFLAFGLSVIALLTAGIIIGLSLNKDTLHFQQKIAATSPPTHPAPSIVHTTAQQLPVPAAIPNTPPVTARPADSVARIISQPAPTTPAITKKEVKTTGPLIKTSGTKTSKEKAIHPAVQTNFIPVTRDSAAGVSAVVHREAVHRTDVAPEYPDRQMVRATLANQVSVGANGYTVGTFGGINDLQLTVTNRSVYPLDLVIVEVQYVQANKKVFKTENMYFRGVGAGAALMLEAPKSSRGIKVHYKITTISSKELGLSYSGI